MPVVGMKVQGKGGSPVRNCVTLEWEAQRIRTQTAFPSIFHPSTMKSGMKRYVGTHDLYDGVWDKYTRLSAPRLSPLYLKLLRREEARERGLEQETGWKLI